MKLYKLNVSKHFFDNPRPRPITFIKNALDFFKDVPITDIEKVVINDKVVIFPISSCYYTDEVKRYLDLGFKPLFVRVKDFKEIKKEIYNLQSIEVKE